MQNTAQIQQNINKLEADLRYLETELKDLQENQHGDDNAIETNRRLTRNLKKRLARANAAHSAQSALQAMGSEQGDLTRDRHETPPTTENPVQTGTDLRTAAITVQDTFTHFVVKGFEPQHWGKDSCIKDAIQRLRDTGWKKANGLRYAYWGTADIRVENGEVKASQLVALGEV